MISITRRGFFVISVISLGEISALFFGARSLNFVVAPLMVLLLISAIRINRIGRIDIRKTVSDRKFEDEDVVVELNIRSGSRFQAKVWDTVVERDGEVSSEHLPFETRTVIGDRSASVRRWEEKHRQETEIEYTLTSMSRGEYLLGKTSITAMDDFGIFKKRLECEFDREFLILPQLYELRGIKAVTDSESTETPEYDYDGVEKLREYQRGDPTSHIDWKMSAKSIDSLIVRDSTSDSDQELEEMKIRLTASESTSYDYGSSNRNGDGNTREADLDMAARACASLAYIFIKNGNKAGLITPSDEIEPDVGKDHLYDVLEALARFDDVGDLPSNEQNADVVVEATESGVIIRNEEGSEYRLSEHIQGPLHHELKHEAGRQ